MILWWDPRDLNPSYARLKVWCLTTRLESRCSCIFMARRSALPLGPCAPAFLCFAATASQFRGGDIFRCPDFTISPHWLGWRRETESNCYPFRSRPSFQDGLHPRAPLSDIWRKTTGSNRRRGSPSGTAFEAACTPLRTVFQSGASPWFRPTLYEFSARRFL